MTTQPRCDATITRMGPTGPDALDLWVAVAHCCDLTFGPDALDQVIQENDTHQTQCPVVAQHMAERRRAA